MRLFVAFGRPAAVLDELDALVEPFRASRLDLRWTNREAWHVTMAFLGQVDEATAARLLPRLERAARRHHNFGLAFSGARAFPAAEPPNALWSGLSGERSHESARRGGAVGTAAGRGARPPGVGRPARGAPRASLRGRASASLGVAGASRRPGALVA